VQQVLFPRAGGAQRALVDLLTLPAHGRHSTVWSPRPVRQDGPPWRRSLPSHDKLSHQRSPRKQMREPRPPPEEPPCPRSVSQFGGTVPCWYRPRCRPGDRPPQNNARAPAIHGKLARPLIRGRLFVSPASQRRSSRIEVVGAGVGTVDNTSIGVNDDLRLDSRRREWWWKSSLPPPRRYATGVASVMGKGRRDAGPRPRAVGPGE
jgi:hypothetical protein